MESSSTRPSSGWLITAALAASIVIVPALAAQTTAVHAHTRAASASDPAAAAVPMKSLGNKNAPITMEVFSDYQCPSCGNFFEVTLRPMINEYVAQGKVYLIHHDFPLQMHTHSGDAARWANAAAKIGEFQEVDAALFDNQNTWSTNGDIEKYVAAAMSPTDFKRVQAILKPCTSPPPTSRVDGSAPPADRACPVDQYIVQDIILGYQVPVKATPTFIVRYKGQSYPASSGIVSWPILKQFFDSLLSQ
jgi:protein-disulfide isomerase